MSRQPEPANQSDPMATNPAPIAPEPSRPAPTTFDGWWRTGDDTRGVVFRDAEVGAVAGLWASRAWDARGQADAAELAEANADASAAWQHVDSMAAQLAAKDAEIAALRASSSEDIRAQGWAVAVHNDYRQGGQSYTFWLFTRNDQCVRGEGRTDAEALNWVRDQLGELERHADGCLAAPEGTA